MAVFPERDSDEAVRPYWRSFTLDALLESDAGLLTAFGGQYVCVVAIFVTILALLWPRPGPDPVLAELAIPIHLALVALYLLLMWTNRTCLLAAFPYESPWLHPSGFLLVWGLVWFVIPGTIALF